MTTDPEDPDNGRHDQDAEPPTPDGQEPEVTPSGDEDEPGSNPDPDPGAQERD